MRLEETFMHFLLTRQLGHHPPLNFLILMESIITAARYIQYQYDWGGEQGELGETDATNTHGERVMKFDRIAHETVLHYLEESRQVIHAVSEEEEDAIPLNSEGRYYVYFDPLDGSSNIAHSLPVGFMFGIGKQLDENRLHRGSDFIAAGMFLIPSGIFTFGLKDGGTWRFLLDQAGVYVRPERVELPADTKGWELSFNSSYRTYFEEPVEKWLAGHESKYGFRYTGSLAVDIHRLLKNGGAFLYPGITRHPNPKKNRPGGKLRLLYECAVMGFLVEQAGGSAIDERGVRILDRQPSALHERAGLIIGSTPLVEQLRTVVHQEPDDGAQ